ncbi:MAG TPA: agmatinase [Alphaproteobacteria bacterium]|nr:agmatinase [Alphaproteobacteria bacterium]
MGTPTFAIPPTFMGVSRHGRDAPFCVAGIPLDIATTNRSGARGGPQAVRHASRMLVDGHHPASWLDPATVAVADIGDFAIALGNVEKSLALIEQQAAAMQHLIALGGDHAVTLALLRAARQRHGVLGLVHFDAHVDTWPDSFGLKYGHGSVFFHAIEEGLIDPRRTIQIGIRSPVQREVWDWTIGKGVTVVSAEDVHAAGPAAIAERVRAVVGEGNVYLSFDIDALDPAFAPGTGTPEIGGLATWQTQAILRRLGGLRFVGMDVVEVSPPYDVAEITALAAATVVYEYLSLVASPRA